MGDRLKGKNAVVTGGGRGIGRTVCLAMAQEGANIVVCDLGGAMDGTGQQESSPADEVVKECEALGVKAISNHGNVASFSDAEGMIKACVDNFGRIDILVNIAGIDRPKMIWNMSEEEFDQVVAVHLKGTFNTTRHAAPLMREQRYGRIINCVSEAYQGGVTHINYGAAKGGIASFSYGTARELGKYGVTCNVFVPRASTRMVQGEDVKKMIAKRVEAGLMTQEKADEMALDTMPPEYFANFMAYLASDEAKNINGQVFLTTPGALGLFSQPEIVLQERHNPDEDGPWTFDQCAQIAKGKLLVNYKNPSPEQPPKEKK
jgi:NAD(P)-dependent dehydrogenase (short-subunit alcohol dehydrogenase family)